MVDILFTEGFSCQRDLIKNLKSSDFLNKIRVYATHSKNRLEIFKYADDCKVINRQGMSEDQFIQEHLDYCSQKQVGIVITGMHTKLFEKHRTQFESKGISLFNGVVGIQNHLDVNDKLAFTAKCQENNLPVVPAYPFKSRAEFDALYAEKVQQYGILAVKPSQGVYAKGFFKLDPQISLFAGLSTPYVVNPNQFADAYGLLTDPPLYMLMPYLSGQECTVDAACIGGELVSAVVRTKQEGETQLIDTEHQCIELAKKFVALFKCDGIVGIQFIQDDQGQWFALEINPRASGGVGYSMVAGINISALLIDEVLRRKGFKIFIQSRPWLQSKALVRPVTVAETLN